MIQRWKLIPSKRSYCRGPLNSWSQIYRKPLLGAPAVDVLPLIAYHGGIQDSFLGFSVR
jgi:hypothetical protein